MSSQPLVSGITIFWNADEKFFHEAIGSVLAQTYDNWELLLVDDGSTNGSTAVARRYAEQYPMKVRYLEHEGHQNRGMSASRNLGIRHAKGEYIAFLDADDVWLPPKLERQVAILNSQPETAMVCASTQKWYSWAGNPEDVQLDSMRELGVQPNTLFEPPTLLTLFLRGEAKTPATCSVLVRREVFQEIGGFEESFRGMYEDQAFFAKVYLKAPVFVTSEYWDKYRHHPDNCCAVAENTGQYHPLKPNLAHLTFLNWIAEYFSQQKVQDTEVWKALQKSLWPYRHRFLKLIGRQLLPVSLRKWLRTSITK